MNGLDLLLIVLVVIGALYVARRLDEWEEDCEMARRYEESMRLAREALDRPLQDVSA